MTETLNGRIVDLDLDKEDAALREAIGQSTLVRVRGIIIEFEHPSLWSTTAMNAVNNADWIGWAKEVIVSVEQLKHFESFNLRNYQMQAIFERLNKDAGSDLGKSKESEDSSLAIRMT